jgi:hypothetical protein
MKEIIGIIGLLWIIIGCSTSKDVEHNSNQLINSSVSPRAEQKYIYNNKGSQGFSGTNSEERFDRSIAETRLNNKAEADTLDKNFVRNGKSINTENFACEIYSVEDQKPEIEARNQ